MNKYKFTVLNHDELIEYFTYTFEIVDWREVPKEQIIKLLKQFLKVLDENQDEIQDELTWDNSVMP